MAETMKILKQNQKDYPQRKKVQRYLKVQQEKS